MDRRRNRVGVQMIFESGRSVLAASDTVVDIFAVESRARSLDDELDNELQAAIEYKIAAAGAHGAEKVLELLNDALVRLLR